MERTSWEDKKNAIMRTSTGAYLCKAGKFEEALPCFEEAIELDPRNAVAWLGKGMSLLNLHRFEEALPCFDKSIELDPDEEGTRVYRQICQIALDNIELF